MLHKIRWTTKKIAQRLALIEPLVYRRSAPIPPFRYQALNGPDGSGHCLAPMSTIRTGPSSSPTPTGAPGSPTS